VEKSMEAPQKIKNKMPYDPVIPFLGCKQSYNKGM
jgi:hypothetical protein